MRSELVKRYPFASTFIASLVTLTVSSAVFVATLWQPFTDKKIPQWLAERDWSMKAAVAVWLCGALVVSGLVTLVVYVIWKFALAGETESENRPVIHARYVLEHLWRNGQRIEVNNPRPLVLENAGVGTAFQVEVSDIDLGYGEVAKFATVPSVAQQPVSISARLEQNDEPFALGGRDLAGALARSVNDRQVFAGGTSYPLRITYRDAQGKLFESLCEIQVSDVLNVQTVFLNSNLVRPKRFGVRRAKPNIVLTGHGSTRLIEDEFGTFFENRNGEHSGLVLRLRNEPARRRKPLVVKKVQARIRYFHSSGNQCADISHSTWLRERYNYTNLDVGVERILVIGLLETDANQQIEPGPAPAWHVMRFVGLRVLDDMREGPLSWDEPPRTISIQDSHIKAQITLFNDDGVIGKDLKMELLLAENGVFTFRPTQQPSRFVRCQRLVFNVLRGKKSQKRIAE